MHPHRMSGRLLTGPKALATGVAAEGKGPMFQRGRNLHRAGLADKAERVVRRHRNLVGREGGRLDPADERPPGLRGLHHSGRPSPRVALQGPAPPEPRLLEAARPFQVRLNLQKPSLRAPAFFLDERPKLPAAPAGSTPK
eukprot:1156652-Lingulodinium_polyedra.AAC.1